MGMLEGKDAIHAIHEYDRALNTVLDFVNCTEEDRVATCQTIEKNDWLLAAGIESIRYSESVINFND